MRKERAFYLLQELGNIDDSFIDAAYRYPSYAKHRTSVIKRLSSFAAAAVILLAVCVTWINTRAPETVSDVLKNTKGDLIETVGITGNETAGRVIWRTYDGRLYQRFVSERDIKLLSSYIGTGENADGTESTGIDGVWLVSPDGSVRSPYLSDNAGNLAYLDIFDYSPEVIPSSSFVSALKDVLD